LEKSASRWLGRPMEVRYAEIIQNECRDFLGLDSVITG
jgi:hypothetical protein